MNSTLTTIKGSLQRIIYNKDGFAIFTFLCPEYAKELKERHALWGNDLDRWVKCKGNMIAPTPGLVYSLQGEVEISPQFGPTFVFKEYDTHYPRDVEIIQQYLIENCAGVGPSTAEKITDEFGEDSLEVCKDSPEKIAGVKGVTKLKALAISETLKKNEDLEKTILELKKITAKARISKKAFKAILNLWQHKAIGEINSNPYKLMQFQGVGFSKSDKVAVNIGFDLDSPFRIRAGLNHILSENARQNGHTYMIEETLVDETSELLKLSPSLIQEELGIMLENGKVKCYQDKIPHPSGWEKSKIALKEYWEKAQTVSQKIKELSAQPPTLQAKNHVDLSGLTQGQKEAIKQALANNVFILTGSPGTGKTYTIRTLVEHFSKYEMQLALCAPTGKAASKIGDSTGYQATTIHRLLAAQRHINGKFSFTYNEDFHLQKNLVIVDEVSMVDLSLFYSLLVALDLEAGTRLVLIGDTNQLPSVGPGNVLKDLITSGIPTVELTEIKRQDAGYIIQNCHRIKEGQMCSWDNSPDSDFFFAGSQEMEDISNIIKNLLFSSKEGHNRIKNQFEKKMKREIDLFSDVQILTPTRENTDLSCKGLNEMIQPILNTENNPHIDPEKADRIEKFWVGDKVIQLKNNYDLDIINGDIGRMVSILPKEYIVKFENPTRTVKIKRKNHNLDLAYALTVHKYQGSECPIVIIPIHKGFGSLIMQRNWIYTAISRAKNVLILVGQITELEKTINRNKQVKRLTLLEDFLK